MKHISGPDYFRPPHGGRPPSDEAVREATKRYVETERAKATKSKDSVKQTSGKIK